MYTECTLVCFDFSKQFLNKAIFCIYVYSIILVIYDIQAINLFAVLVYYANPDFFF